jgi:hypothetical protein
MNYIVPDKAYKALKWAGLIACPAMAVFVGTVGPVWGWPNVDAWVTTINAAGVLVGALLGISAVTARPSDDGGE